MPTRARTCPPAGPPRGRPAGWGYVKRVPSYPPAAAAFASPGAGAQGACGCTGPSCCWRHCWPWSRHSSVSGAVGGSSGTRGARAVVLAVSCPWAPWGSHGFPVGPHTGTGWGGGWWHWASQSRIGPRVGCGVGVGPPSTGLSPSLGMGSPQYKMGSASPLLCAHGDPTGTPSLCAQAMPRGPRGDRVPQPVGQRRDAGGALTPSSPALQLS